MFRDDIRTWRSMAEVSVEAELGIKTGIYRHFKGNLYLVVGVAQHTETGEKLVIYIPQGGTYAGQWATRPLAMFLETVERPELKYHGPRFVLIREKKFQFCACN